MLYLLLWYIVLVILALYVINQLTLGIVKSPVCLAGKTAIVTGGNEGIGYQIVLMLAARGCRVIIADVANAEDSKRKIIQETNNPNIVTKYLDLASFKSVREFAEDINKTEKAIHILIHNAGVSSSKPIMSDDGVNKTFQINYYSPFLLTHLLIDLLKKSSPSRIIFTSSGASFINNLNEERMNPNNYDLTNSWVASVIYANSKTCIILGANEFARRLKGFGITVNSLHPGCVRTRTVRKGVEGVYNLNVLLFLCTWEFLITITGKNAWEGAQTAVHLAVSKEVESVTGKHFWDCMALPILPPNTNKATSDILWKKSEELTHLKDSEKLKE